MTILGPVFAKRSSAIGRFVEDSTAIQIFAPNQADDAAVVPVTIKIPSSVAPAVKSLTLIIDRNPVPIAATFAFGDGFRQGPDVGERTLATRVRVDAFSRIRAVLETTEGVLHMTSKFVIGSGGCSAPASKDPEEALAQMGKTRLVVSRDEATSTAWREARVMIRHPNFTGMQMNKKTGDYTPARFRQLHSSEAGRHSSVVDGGRNFDLGRSEYPLHVRDRKPGGPRVYGNRYSRNQIQGDRLDISAFMIGRESCGASVVRGTRQGFCAAPQRSDPQFRREGIALLSLPRGIARRNTAPKPAASLWR